MKLFLLFFFTVFITITSCTTTKYYSKNTYLLDFRPYADQGFLMSTTTIGESYKALGDIMIECESGYTTKDGKSPNQIDNPGVGSDENPIYSSYTIKKGKYKQWEVQEVLDLLYDEAKEIGADGVINIRLTSTGHSGSTDFEISGLAIELIN
jgi:hypothetical protein